MKFLSGLALLFIALKLCGVIAWSWWFVLLPLYIPILVVFGIIAGIFRVVWLSEKIKAKFNKNKY